ncbi:MAG TPA: copper homeostasis protein CutC [Planctomycetes bacterium]|nr:copper homeostasis protein CutC [Planctomycetota bacterium]HIN80702.1 copper homeostasis protein CutC [Planctomycetota bacterium]
MVAVRIEVTVEEISGALAAEESGASRLEVCSALDLGGLTPSAGLLHRICERVSIPVIAMIRPRPGNFITDETDHLLAEEEIARALDVGASGIAWGALDSAGNIDAAVASRVVEAAGGRPVTFHRAFDSCSDQQGSMEKLIDLGFRSLLTSGGAASALEGADAIATLVSQAANRIEIIAAGGVHPVHAAELVAATGSRWLHLSARKIGPAAHLIPLQPDLAPRSVPVAGERAFTDPGMIRSLHRVLEGLSPRS